MSYDIITVKNVYQHYRKECTSYEAILIDDVVNFVNNYLDMSMTLMPNISVVKNNVDIYIKIIKHNIIICYIDIIDRIATNAIREIRFNVKKDSLLELNSTMKEEIFEGMTMITNYLK